MHVTYAAPGSKTIPGYGREIVNEGDGKGIKPDKLPGSTDSNQI